MPLLIGTDEAGYGPNLGPLLIGLSAWQVPAEITERNLLESLGKWVTNELPLRDDERIPIADSKLLYQPARGMGLLEAAVSAVGRNLGWRPQTWGEVGKLFTGNIPDQIWDRDFDFPLPAFAAEDEIVAWQAMFAAGLRNQGISLDTWRAKMVQPREFNERVEQLGSKGTLLSETTLGLIAETITDLKPTDGVCVTCDKHGGRDRYAAVLTHVFPECRLEIIRESRAESVYRMQWNETPIKIGFRSKGERSLPTALASMAAKYLRELAMHAFNAYWQREVPGVPATTGYPGDAKRFWNTIRARQQALKIPDAVLWRAK